jgi:hypothetical protein
MKSTEYTILVFLKIFLNLNISNFCFYPCIINNFYLLAYQGRDNYL